MAHVLFFFFLCVASGEVLAARLHLMFIPVFFCGAVCVAAALLLRRHARAFIIFLVLASVCLGGALRLSSPAKGLAAGWDARINALKTHGTACDVTVDSSLKTTRVRGGKTYRTFTAKDVRIGGGPVRGGILVSVPKKSPLVYGDRIRVTGVLEPLAAKRNPAGFDERRYWTSRGVYARLYGRTSQPLKEDTPVFARFCYGLKNALMRRLDSALPEEPAAIAKALLLGERAEIDPGLKRALVRTGTFHLFAISGSNVALVAGFFFFMFCLLRTGERAAAALTVVVVFVYCVLAGSDPPVLRASVAVICYLIANASGNRADPLNTLGLAGTVMLLWNPEEVFDASFQLSFAAVAGILLIVPFASPKSAPRSKSASPLTVAASRFLTFASVCLVTGTAVTPVAVHYFHRLNLLSFFANLALSPIVAALNALLVVFAALPFLPAWTAAPVVPLVAAMRVVAHAFDADPRWCLPLEPWTWPVWLLFAAAIAGLFKIRGLKHPFVRLAAVVLVTLNCALINETAVKADGEPTRLTFFDVGQGDAALFEFSDGSNLLIDAGRGGSDGAEHVITPYLLSRGIRRLDAVVISHPQADHCGGLEAIIREFEVGLIADNGEGADIAFYRNLRAAMADRHVRHQRIADGDRLEGFPRAKVEVLHPSRNSAREALSDPNETSVVLKVTPDNGHAVLFTGDIGEEGLSRLLGVHPRLKTDILKVPHHGAKPGPEAVRFLRSARPESAVISVGRNGYGHPNPATLTLLEGLSGGVERTDRDGAVRFFFFDDGKVRMEPFGEVNA